MKIERLDIKGFGKLSNLNITFNEGFNIIFGKNESGKSSLQWFIKSMLFGLRGGKALKDGTPSPVKRFKPWQTGEFSGLMEYRLQNGEVFKVVRNFAGNSIKLYDSSFNDITQSFEISKEKGVAFSEKHLGINEACFDRTVFIRQMESVIDEDGSRELLNRLINVSQTGFEDVSFKKAQEALKEALKNYVGTDKTTTRPLDKLVTRIEELKNRKDTLITKRDNLFSTEEELNKALELKAGLEGKKDIISRLNGFICMKINMRSITKLRNEVREIAANIIKDEDELKTVVNRLSDFKNIKEEFIRFSRYENEDIDRLEVEYQKLLRLTDDNSRLILEVAKKQEQLTRLNKMTGFMKNLDGPEADLDFRVRGLEKELEAYRAEQARINPDALNSEIVKNKRRIKLFSAIMVAGAVAELLSSVLLFLVPFIGIPLIILGLAILIAAAVARKNRNTALKKLSVDKNLLTIRNNELNEGIRKKEAQLKEIYTIADCDNLQGFLLKKADYSSKLQQAAELNRDIIRLEGVIENNSDRIAAARGSIEDKLNEVGLKLDPSLEINNRAILDFKYGVRRYKGNEPSIVYSSQRIEDLEKGINSYFKNLSIISGVELCSKEDINGQLEELDNEFTAIAGELEAINSSMTELVNSKEVLKLFSSEHGEKYIDENLDETARLLDSENNRIIEELNKTELSIKEYETELRHLPEDEEELSGIDVELEELELKKNELEDINISLKTALEVLTEASSEIQRDFVPALNVKMSEFITRISSGKYSDLRADDRLVLKTVAPETGDVVNANILSGGTADQMYLALRIAMSEIFTSGKETLPLIMDEVFSQYDDERTAETMKLLRSIAGNRQIVLFTCKSREVEIARDIFGGGINVIGL